MSDASVSVAFDPATEVLDIRLSGEIDIASAPALRAELLSHVVRHRPARLLVQLDEVTFFGAEGMRLLHDLGARSGASIDLRCTAGAPARRVLELFCNGLAAR